MSASDIFGNVWVISIITGILSGLIVNWIANKIAKNKQSREYLLRIEAANNELRHSLRPLIVERKIITDEIFESITNAIERKHGLKMFELDNFEELVNDLTLEILSNPFLTIERKEEYTHLLKETLDKYFEEDAEDLKSTSSIEKEIENESIFDMLSNERRRDTVGIITVAATILTTITAFFITQSEGKLGNPDVKFFEKLPIYLTAIVIALSFLLILIWSLRQLKEIKQYRLKKDDDTPND